MRKCLCVHVPPDVSSLPGVINVAEASETKSRMVSGLRFKTFVPKLASSGNILLKGSETIKKIHKKQNIHKCITCYSNEVFQRKECLNML